MAAALVVNTVLSWNTAGDYPAMATIDPDDGAYVTARRRPAHAYHPDRFGGGDDNDKRATAYRPAATLQ